MSHVTLKRPHGSTAATVTVPGGTEYKVNHDGLVQVHPDHVHHLRAAGFKHPSEAQAPAPIELTSDDGKADGQAGFGDGSQNGDGGKTPEQLEAERKERADKLKAEREAKKAAKEAAKKGDAGDGKSAGTEGAAGAEGETKPAADPLS